MNPALSSGLPTLTCFLDDIYRDRAEGRLSSEQQFSVRCECFFTDEAMNQIEAVVPGWQAMASYAAGATLRHTAAAMVAMLDLVEYQTASPHQQRLME